MKRIFALTILIFPLLAVTAKAAGSGLHRHAHHLHDACTDFHRQRLRVGSDSEKTTYADRLFQHLLVEYRNGRGDVRHSLRFGSGHRPILRHPAPVERVARAGCGAVHLRIQHHSAKPAAQETQFQAPLHRHHHHIAYRPIRHYLDGIQWLRGLGAGRTIYFDRSHPGCGILVYSEMATDIYILDKVVQRAVQLRILYVPIEHHQRIQPANSRLINWKSL